MWGILEWDLYCCMIIKFLWFVRLLLIGHYYSLLQMLIKLYPHPGFAIYLMPIWFNQNFNKKKRKLNNFPFGFRVIFRFRFQFQRKEIYNIFIRRKNLSVCWFRFVSWILFRYSFLLGQNLWVLTFPILNTRQALVYWCSS